MSDNIVLGIFQGVVVFVVGQIAQKYVLDPIFELRRVRGEVAGIMLAYGNTCGIVNEDYANEARVAYRAASAHLQQVLSVLPVSDVTARWSINRSPSNIRKASAALVGLSNIAGTENVEHFLRFQAIVYRELGLYHEEYNPGGKQKTETSSEDRIPDSQNNQPSSVAPNNNTQVIVTDQPTISVGTKT